MGRFPVVIQSTTITLRLIMSFQDLYSFLSPLSEGPSNPVVIKRVSSTPSSRSLNLHTPHLPYPTYAEFRCQEGLSPDILNLDRSLVQTPLDFSMRISTADISLESTFITSQATRDANSNFRNQATQTEDIILPLRSTSPQTSISNRHLDQLLTILDRIATALEAGAATSPGISSPSPLVTSPNPSPPHRRTSVDEVIDAIASDEQIRPVFRLPQDRPTQHRKHISKERKTGRPRKDR